jgi:hypothetical protein
MPTPLAENSARRPWWRRNPFLYGIAAALLLTLPAAPIPAAEPAPCPPESTARLHRCQAEALELERLGTRITATEAMVRDPEVLLVKVEPEPAEDSLHFQHRVARQGGVRTLETNTFLPIIERYPNPDTGAIFVALARLDFWQYVGEALGYASVEAAQVFRRREELSNREKRGRFLAPGGELDRLRADLQQRTAFTAACCTALHGAEGLPAQGTALPGPLPGPFLPQPLPVPMNAP